MILFYFDQGHFLFNFRSLGNAIEKRDRIAPVVRKVNDLEILLDPTIGSELTGLTADCVADLVIF